MIVFEIGNGESDLFMEAEIYQQHIVLYNFGWAYLCSDKNMHFDYPFDYPGGDKWINFHILIDILKGRCDILKKELLKYQISRML